MSLISRMFFVGLAKRAYVPGVKHDDAPVFEGAQGEGKSTALSVLGGEWFADTPFRMGDKDGYLSIQGILIYEIAELEQFNRSEVTAVKAFMSSQTDRYREPYGRRMKNQPRRTVFAATTNEGQYFKDPTGNRRFWPVETGQIDVEGLRAVRNQLLGEAVHLMRAGVKWFPTREEQARLISPKQASREIWDEWTGRVWEHLEGLDADGKPVLAAKVMQITARELLTRALHLEISKISNAKTETMRISNIMRKLGWKKCRYTDGAREWFYERPEEDKPAQAEPTVEAVDSGGGYDLPI
jgi:predicted P-loop ATPase